MSSLPTTGIDGAVVAIAFAILASLILIKYIYAVLTNPLNKVPGPWHSRWTNLRLKLAVISGQRMYYVHSLHERYGYYVRLSPNEVAVADPKGFQHIHRINSGFNKTAWYQDAVLFPRHTLFTMDDPKQHAARRRLLSRAFSKSSLRQHYEATVKQIVERAVAQIAQRGRDEPVDILQWWTFMATDVSAKLNFGESFNMVDYGKVNQYIRVLQAALQGGGIGAEMPLVRTIGTLIPTETCQNLFRAGPFLIEYARKALEKAKMASDVPSLFQGVIEAAKNSTGIDQLDMQLEATGLIVAGSDTTAVTLTYLVWAVLSQPELHKQLREEVDALREDYSDNDVEDLPIVNAVIEETLRLYGAAPGALPRYVPPGGAELGGYYFPEKTTLTTQAYTLHRNSGIFPNPYRFDHRRWLSKDLGGLQKPEDALASTVFSPFGAGSRICIGIHLARMELRLGVCQFFREIPHARLAPSTSEKSMEMENFFLIAPRSHKCEILT